MTTAYTDPQSIHNPTAGSAIPATWGDTVRNDLEFLIAPPMVMCANASTTIVTGGAMVPFTNAADLWDTDAFHSDTNSTRITIPTGLGGRYNIQAAVWWDTDTAGSYRQIEAIKGGATPLVDIIAAPATYVRQSFSFDVALAAGEYIELFAGQNSGGTRTITGARFGIRWVSR